MSVFVWTITEQQIRDAVERAEREYPFQPGWTNHTTSEAKAEEREDYLGSVIAQLYRTLDEVRKQRNEAVTRPSRSRWTHSNISRRAR